MPTSHALPVVRNPELVLVNTDRGLEFEPRGETVFALRPRLEFVVPSPSSLRFVLLIHSIRKRDQN